MHLDRNKEKYILTGPEAALLDLPGEIPAAEALQLYAAIISKREHAAGINTAEFPLGVRRSEQMAMQNRDAALLDDMLAVISQQNATEVEAFLRAQPEA